MSIPWGMNSILLLEIRLAIPPWYAGAKGGRYGLVKFPNEINGLRWVLHFPAISVLCIHGRRE